MNIIVRGAYQTKFGELWDKSLQDLIFEATIGALKDAGIEKNDIDVVFVGNKMASSISDQNHISAMISQFLGTDIPVIRVESACASGGVAISQACHGLETETYTRALVIGVEKMTDLSIPDISYALMKAASAQERNAGIPFVGLYALIAKAYLETYKATEKDLAYPAIKNHQHAKLNPYAQFPFEISAEKVMSSSLVADPIRLLHCSPISDGAAAVVLEKGTEKNNQHVKIVASTQAGDTLDLSARNDITSMKASQNAAKKAYELANISPQDISLFEVHDCFTISEILALEDLGLCKKGEGYQAIQDKKFWYGGTQPINLSGGLKASGHPVGATGVKQIVEITNQLMGRAGTRQIKNRQYGLTHNVGGTGGTVVIHILKK